MRTTARRKWLVEELVRPVSARRLDCGVLAADFGKAAFGTLLVPGPGQPADRRLVVHLGEKLGPDGRIDRSPPGSVRYRRIEPPAVRGECRIVIPPDKRNTGPAAILMPEAIGEVLPFRYAEVEGAPAVDPAALRQIAVHYPFDDEASRFTSSHSGLNQVWELCKHSIKATTFCGVYVDGDRERIPYEGDAYINQLGHYCLDSDYEVARYTHEYLIQRPTWPTEWLLHSVLMAWEDYLYTGRTDSLEMFYEDLRVKTLIDLAGPDGLISTESDLRTRELEERLYLYHDAYIFSHGLRDLVDWPPGSFTEGGVGERDGHEMRPVNTVVNAFHLRALVLMGRIASALGRVEDASRFAARAELVSAAINRLLFDQGRGIYVDGAGSSHASLHSNVFTLAMGAVPAERVRTVLEFVKSRGMVCSVYGAQHLLDALYRHGEPAHALSLMTAEGDRGWLHMLASGGTITWEAWDWKYKNNLDWNHAWGAAPANIIPRRMMGVRPKSPGWSLVEIAPQLGGVGQATLKHPTPLGPITIEARATGSSFALSAELPPGAAGQIRLPVPPEANVRFGGNGARRANRKGHDTIQAVSEGRIEVSCDW